MSPPHKLFTPIQVGNVLLQHRVALAPCTRMKATKSGFLPVVPLVKEYFSQRGSVPGTLLVTEATFIAPEASGYPYVPGIWNSDHIKAWKEVTDAVHSNGSFIFLQLWAIGRAAQPKFLEALGIPHTAASPIRLSTRPETDPAPRAMTIEEIGKFPSLYAAAAKNAVEAGFDGVEIHGANGYLIDQFLQDVSNTRTDGYGGSIENRSKFGLQVVDAVVKAVGPERTALRISPWNHFQDMRMDDPKPQFSHFISNVVASHPKLAYLHVVEPGSGQYRTNPKFPTRGDEESNDFLREIWAPRPFMSCGEHTRETALRFAEKGDIVAFGQLFISNPDLPYRLQHDIPVTPPNPKTYYTYSDLEGTEKGYIDYPFSDEYLLARTNVKLQNWLPSKV
ncbi:NADH:flavin oxidoreductase/NADH oxidase [Ephemerocybe angulata]|uniref:NADH:flavin oxidoreductase/NADH oxidase n=1 Tax=Ephemerocybe angulata TaxID=980116 RepID=A0A8H6HI62_9AGAR|nr:NADH:flavin oxidoreductase/NADH oxidase [Tulosesus angulatus]